MFLHRKKNAAFSEEKVKSEKFALAKYYAGEYDSKGNLIPQMNLTCLERERAAIRLAQRATELGNDEARIFLAEAFLEGRGCIQADAKKLIAFYSKLALNNNQNAAFELGCFYLGLMPDGNPLPKEIIFPQSYSEGLNYLALSMLGSNITLIRIAISVLNKFFQSSCDFNFNTNILNFICSQVAKTNNPVLSLYLAYAFCPQEKRNRIDSIVDEVSNSFKVSFHFPREFDFYIKQESISICKHYLEISLKGDDTLCQLLASALWVHLGFAADDMRLEVVPNTTIRPFQ